MWGHLGVGRLRAVQGDLSSAIETLEGTLPLCEEGSDLAMYFSRTASSLGLAYVLSDRVREGLALLERTAARVAAIGFAYGHALVVGMLGEGLLAAGDVDGAARRAEEAVEVARRHAQRGWEAWALQLQGHTALARSAHDAAAIRFAEAIALAEERGMRPLLAHCRRGVAHVHAGAGDRGLARKEMAAALAEYRAMAMPYWLTRAESELRDLG